MTVNSASRRFSWKKSAVLGFFLPADALIGIGLFSGACHTGAVALYLLCTLVLWVVMALRSLADPPAEVWEIIFLLFLSLLGPIGLLIIAVCLIRS